MLKANDICSRHEEYLAFRVRYAVSANIDIDLDDVRVPWGWVHHNKVEAIIVTPYHVYLRKRKIPLWFHDQVLRFACQKVYLIGSLKQQSWLFAFVSQIRFTTVVKIERLT